MPTPPITVVLIGATGDLAKRKLLPGLLHLFQTGLLRDLQVVGTSLDQHDRDSFLEFARGAIDEFASFEVKEEDWKEFEKRLWWSPWETGPDGLKAVVDDADEAAGSDKPRDRLHYLSVPPKAALDVVQILKEADLVSRSRIIMEKPFGVDLASLHVAQQGAAQGLQGGPDLPDRPLPGQGGGAEHLGVPVRQRAVRADLAPQPHRPHPDRRARVAGARAARVVLRGHRRLPRHGGHPPVPGARVHRDGAADRAGAVRDLGGEEQGLPVDAADRAARRGARSVRRVPRHRGRRSRVRDRDVRRAEVLRRQLAVGGRAVLPAHRQADGRGRADHLDRLPRAAAVDVPARLGRRRPRPRPLDLRPGRPGEDVAARSTARSPAPACSCRSCRCSSRCTTPPGRVRCWRPTSG